MISNIRNLLGQYVPIVNADGMNVINFEYIVCAVIYIMMFWVVCKSIVYLIKGILKV